jgi:hypothetical protein
MLLIKVTVTFRPATNGLLCLAVIPGETLNMAAPRNFWRNSDKSEKLPVLVLCLCVIVLIALLWFRPAF